MFYVIVTYRKWRNTFIGFVVRSGKEKVQFRFFYSLFSWNELKVVASSFICDTFELTQLI